MDMDTPVKRRPGRPPKTPVTVAENPDVVEQALPARRKRIPFGGLSYKLQVDNKDPNYYYYWQKDVGDNIERMLAAGYEFVTRRMAGKETLRNRDLLGGNQSLDDTVKVFGGRDEYGKDYKLVLMRQPMEYHLEDQALHEQATNAIDNAIYRQQFQGQKIANQYGSVNVSVKDEE